MPPGALRKKDLHFLLMVIVIVGLLVVLSLTGRQRFLSPTPPHLKAASDEACFSCHADGKEFPMTKDHPLRKKHCRMCHRLKGS